MTLKRNTIANYLGQGYTILIGIVMLPLYLQYLGAEAYGLVAFFAMMQAWLGLLDMGLSPTLSRQVAHAHGQSGEKIRQLRDLLRSVEVVFAALALVIGLVIWLGSGWIATKWLTVHTLSHAEVTYCLTLMGIMVGLRWFASLYRSGIQGMERMVWLNTTNAILATLRFVGAYALLRWFAQEPEHFFEFQLVVSFIELGVMMAWFYRILPRMPGHTARFSWSSLKAVMPFTVGIAYTSSIWLLLTQLDKLILSHTLTLADYGYFSLVVVVANGLLSLSAPLSQAILPRMTSLLSQGNEAAMLAIYRKATQAMIVIMLPASGVLAIFSNELLYAWTGNRVAANWAGPVLTWYVLGNGILSIGTFQYYLQFAHGKLRLHVINSTVNAIVQIPILFYAALNYGAVGVAYAWFALRLITFIIWTAVVHQRYAPGLHREWLVKDIAPGVLATALCLTVAFNFSETINSLDRHLIAFSLLAIGTTTVFANLLVYSEGRAQLRKLWNWKLA